jgi:hypothetical protein
MEQAGGKTMSQSIQRGGTLERLSIFERRRRLGRQCCVGGHHDKQGNDGSHDLGNPGAV